MPWRRLGYPVLLLVAGAGPALLCARRLLDQPRLAVATDLSMLWMVLMVWLALGRLRPLEPRPPRRDGASPTWVERVAATLMGVGDLLATMVLPVSLATGGLGMVRSPLRAGPALAGVALVVVALVGLARAARAVLLFGRASMPAALPPLPGRPRDDAPGPPGDEPGSRGDEARSEDVRTAVFAIGSAVVVGVSVGVGAVALLVLAAVARAPS
jgi:hypothetical protein